MSFLSPIAALIAAGVIVPAVVALYFLKLRRREVAISSTLLWKRAIRDLQVNAPFQKMRRNLLLLIQLMLLALLLFALARPTTRSSATPGKRAAILIDHSASMNAPLEGNNGRTRLDEAKAAAEALVDAIAAEAGGGAMVVSFAEQVRVVEPFTTDVGKLRRAIRGIRPTEQRSRLDRALRLVEPFAPSANPQASSGAGGGGSGQGQTSGGASGGGLDVYVMSDGRVQGDRLAALRGGVLRYVPPTVGGAIDNVGVVSLSARRDFEKPEVVQVFARLANYGAESVETNVTLEVDGTAARVSPVVVPAALPEEVAKQIANPQASSGVSGDTRNARTYGSKAVEFSVVLPGSAVVSVGLDRQDQLAADDRAALVLTPSRRLRVLVVGEGNAFLDRVIDAAGVRRRVNMTPTKYEDQKPEFLRRTGGLSGGGGGGGGDEGFDLIMFDGYSPQRVPVVSALYFACTPPVEGLAVFEGNGGDAKPQASAETQGGVEDAGAAKGAQVVLDWRRDHPLLRYVALEDVVIQGRSRVAVPANGEVLATGEAGPLMAMANQDGLQHVVVGFDVLKSNWPLYVSFPVFVSNAVQWLGLGGQLDAGVALRTGEVAVVAVSPGAPGVPGVPGAGGANRLRYRGPVTLEAAVSDGRAALPMLERTGLYRLEGEGGAVLPPWQTVAVNLLDDVESDLRPAAVLQVGTAPITGTGEAAAIRREVWWWFAAAAVALLMIEWVVYTRRMHL